MVTGARPSRRADPVAHRSLRALVTVLVGAVVAAGCAAAPTDDATPAAVQVETMPPTTGDPAGGGCDLVTVEAAEPLPEGVEPGVAPTLPPGVDTGYAGSGAGSGNPYVVPGARPVPGPSMPVTTVGPEPVTVVVLAPPNPDVGTPAAIPEGETTIPAPPSTLPAAAATTVIPGESTTSTTGLMELADDPGCVSSPGEP